MTSIPRPSTTELPLAVARLVILGGGCEMKGVAGGAGGRAGMETGGGGVGASAGVGGRAGGATSFPASAPFFFGGFFPFPLRGGAAAGSGPFVSVRFTTATSASYMKGFSVVATTFLYFRAVASISQK